MSKIETKEVFVAIKHLSVIWIQAQRPYREAWAKEIADNFDPDKFDPPVITKPNGEGHYHIVEGQHRVGAAKIAFGENEQIKCRMVDADDPERAAEIFLGINKGRKAIKPVVSFQVAVVAKREPETDINRMVNNLGLGYRISATKSDYCITAVSSLIYVYNRQGRAILNNTLKVLNNTWEGDASAFNGEIIKGYAVFLNEYQSYSVFNATRLATATAKVFTPERLLRASKLHAEQHRTPLSEGISETLRSKYNSNLKDSQKLKRK